MIRLSTSCGIEFVAAENIARITEAGVSSQWHGIRAIVRLFDGGVIEARESAQDIARLLAAAPDAPRTRQVPDPPALHP